MTMVAIGHVELSLHTMEEVHALWMTTSCTHMGTHAPRNFYHQAPPPHSWTLALRLSTASCPYRRHRRFQRTLLALALPKSSELSFRARRYTWVLLQPATLLLCRRNRLYRHHRHSATSEARTTKTSWLLCAREPRGIIFLDQPPQHCILPEQRATTHGHCQRKYCSTCPQRVWD